MLIYLSSKEYRYLMTLNRWYFFEIYLTDGYIACKSTLRYCNYFIVLLEVLCTTVLTLAEYDNEVRVISVL